MKRITTLFFSLLCIAAVGQNALVYEGNIANYQTVYDDFTEKPSNAVSVQMNRMVYAIGTYWDSLDIFYLYANHTNDNDEALINWITPGTHDATNVHSTSYTAFEGFTGDGANDYLNTNYNPNTDGVNYTLDDASIGVYVRTNVRETAAEIGVIGLDIDEITQILTRLQSEDFGWCINSESTKVTNTDSRGFFIALRVDATNHYGYKNKTQNSDAVASNVVPNGSIYVLARNDISTGAVIHSTKQISVAFAGGGLSQTAVNTITDAVEGYMDSNGKGVISGTTTNAAAPTKVLTYDGKVIIHYEPESRAIFAAMGTAPSTARKRIIDNLVRGLKDDGLWDMLDFLHIYAAHAENSSLLNWINPGTHDATNVHATAFTVDEGYTGDGANDYLNTNYNPNTDGVNYAQNSVSFALYVRTDINHGSGGGNGIDKTNSLTITPRLNGNSYIKTNDDSNGSVANGDGRGFYVNRRIASANKQLYRNSSEIMDDVQNSTGVPNANIYILAVNDPVYGGDRYNSSDQISVASVGAGLSQTNVDNFTDRIETYMDAIGSGVISEVMWLILLLIPNVFRREKEYKIAA